MRPSSVSAAERPERDVFAEICFGWLPAAGWQVMRYWCDWRAWLRAICLPNSGSSVERRVSLLMPS